MKAARTTALLAMLLVPAAGLAQAGSKTRAIHLAMAPSATEGCGLVSNEGPTPESIDLFPAVVLRINDDSPVPRNEYRLQPGKHVLVVAEAIPRYRLGTAQQRQIAQMQRRRSHVGYYKALVVDVRADRMYRVGAHLLREKLDGAGIDANAYWQPVVWEERPQPCR